MNLLIVESPAKSKTLKKFLGKDFEIAATVGHIRDLPKSKLGIDVENDFKPEYITIVKKRSVASALKKQGQKADKVFLASVDHQEPILIKCPDGSIKQFQVGDFIDSALDKKLDPSLFEVPAFNFKNKKVSFKPIRGVVRHPIKKNILEITLQYGRKIKITPSHSVFTKNEKGEIKTVAGKNLKVNDKILVPLKVPRSTKRIKEVDLLKEIYHDKNFRKQVFISSPSISNYRKEKVLAPKIGNIHQFQPRLIISSKTREILVNKRVSLGWSQEKLAQRVRCSQTTVCDIETGKSNTTLQLGTSYFNGLGLDIKQAIKSQDVQIAPSSIEVAINNALENQWRDSRKSLTRTWQPLEWFSWEEIEKHFKNDKTLKISRHNHSHLMPRFIPVNKDLMLLLGFLTAEGSFLDKEKYLRFSFGKKHIGGERNNIKRVKKISQKLFNLTPLDIEEKTANVLVLKSTLVTFLIKNVLGFNQVGASNKEVPWIVFNVSRELQLSFLEGEFLGDGSLGKGQISFNTVSPRLAHGIRFIMLQNGVITSHTISKPTRKNRKPSHSIIVCNKKRLKKISPIWEKHYKSKTLKKHIKKRNRIKQDWSLVQDQENDLGLLKIKNIKKVKSSNNYVYDFSVEGENFICGSGGICAHNTDPDREGEAIAWHTAKAMGLKDYQRVVFHEITEQAVKNALKNPRKINQDLFNAQQARRILDRIVGYKLSPLLWKKIAKGLSAGRVQSVALNLIVKREKEIDAFIPQEYWSIQALLEKNKEFKAVLIKKDDKSIPRLGIENKKQANQIIKDLDKAEYIVENIEKKEVKRNPSAPFTTSTLQQESWKRFRWPAQMTMSIAQKLYEQGHITYHRSDSFTLSQESLNKAKKIIKKQYGKEYYPGSTRIFKTKSKSAQEAHEAIRPSYPENLPESLSLEEKQAKLYNLIWSRFIACQMNPAIFDATSIDIKAKNYTFRTTGQILKFDGFLKVYSVKFEQEELPDLEKQDVLNLKKLKAIQHHTKPAARYTEASLIKELEKNGIGRPSTYAPIISVIQKRNYTIKNEVKRFEPTEIGILVSDLLTEHFPQIVDLNFTAKMEEDLDKIAQGKKEWVKVIKDFYNPFEENLKNKEKDIKKHIEKTDEKCPECGKDLLVRMSRFGKFYGCSGFPKCKYTKPFEGGLDIKCPKCKTGQVTEKRTKKKKIFYGCNKWPDCDFALWDKPTGDKCPKCDSFFIQKKNGEIRCVNEECKLG